MIQLMNNRMITVMDTATIMGCSYTRAGLLKKTLKYDILEAYDLANHLKIPLDDLCKILKNDKETLKKYLIP